jgi:hypothetical protein
MQARRRKRKTKWTPIAKMTPARRQILSAIFAHPTQAFSGRYWTPIMWLKHEGYITFTHEVVGIGSALRTAIYPKLTAKGRKVVGAL